MDVLSGEYAERLSGQRVLWKRLFDVQAPYRWNLRRLRPGRTLDIGCGVGRNLINVDGIGIDPNRECVEQCRERGLEAYHPDEFSAPPTSFDTLLFAHVVEHLSTASGHELVRRYLPYLRPGGKVIFITPQERGYLSDETHVRFYNFEGLRKLAEAVGLRVEKSYSFPFGRWAQAIFKYNEFVLVSRKV